MGSAVGRKFLALPYYSQRAVFAPLSALFSFNLFFYFCHISSQSHADFDCSSSSVGLTVIRDTQMCRKPVSLNSLTPSNCVRRKYLQGRLRHKPRTYFFVTLTLTRCLSAVADVLVYCVQVCIRSQTEWSVTSCTTPNTVRNFSPEKMKIHSNHTGGTTENHCGSPPPNRFELQTLRAR